MASADLPTTFDEARFERELLASDEMAARIAGMSVHVEPADAGRLSSARGVINGVLISLLIAGFALLAWAIWTGIKADERAQLRDQETRLGSSYRIASQEQGR